MPQTQYRSPAESNAKRPKERMMLIRGSVGTYVA